MLRFATHRPLAAVALALAFVGSASARPGQVQGNLHLLPVGISQYERPGNDLQWADQDAIDHAKFWRTQEGVLFNRVFGKPLLNRDGTRAAILRAMADIADQVQPGDTVIAPWSGHGWRHNHEPNGEWEFCAADGFITATELRAWAVKLTQKGARVILIIDACHAGACDINMDGAVVIASSQADETSLDGDPDALRGNGVFTQVLLEGLSGKAAKNGVVTVGGLVDYVARLVPERVRTVGHRQQPRAFMAPTAADLEMARPSGAAPAESAPGTGPTTGPETGPITGPSR
jgi:hypothetical protein